MIHKKAVGRIWALVFVTSAILSSFLLFTRNGNAAQETPVLKVGDHDEYVDVYRGTVTEIGTGTDKGCYRIDRIMPATLRIKAISHALSDVSGFYFSLIKMESGFAMSIRRALCTRS